MNAPTFTPDLVGTPANVNFVSNNAYGNIQPMCHDRWILESNDAAMVVMQPKNPNSPTLLTTGTNMVVVVYPLAKWVEF